MRLLIVDDEKLTREGLLSSIDLKGLSIDEVQTAEDGLSGLACARSFRPDIVLTDVRMPKMDGIKMMESIQEILPETAVIFMSGFSDKEYLKAAIKLHAVSYVEKPINEEELNGALFEALSFVREKKEVRERKDDEKSNTDFSLALKLIRGAEKKEDEEKLRALFSFDIEGYNNCFSAIISCYDTYFLITRESAFKLYDAFAGLLDNNGIRTVFTINNSYFVFHFFTKKELSEGVLTALGESLCGILSSMLKSFHAVIGRQVSSFLELPHSYNTAVINLQQCFFKEDNICLLYKHIPGKTEFKSFNNEEMYRSFKELLKSRDRERTEKFFSDILKSFTEAEYALPNQARELYYRLFQVITEVGISEKLQRDKYLPKDDLWERISLCHSVFELDGMLKDSADVFFLGEREKGSESTVVYSIKNFIAENYEDANLSIVAISEYVNLSNSYVCTLFKSETGMTINQYITDYRLERAKELLLDNRNRILDIAGRVGYSDSNYFSKIFRKSFGVSPSEYREGMGL